MGQQHSVSLVCMGQRVSGHFGVGCGVDRKEVTCLGCSEGRSSQLGLAGIPLLSLDFHGPILRWLLLLCVACDALPAAFAVPPGENATRPSLEAARIRPQDATLERLRGLHNRGINTILFELIDETPAARSAIQSAVDNAEQMGLEVGYWVEVARCPPLADAHPEWMASLQTHDEWRRRFPETPEPKANEVVKAYPWVPILSQETFAAQRTRVLRLLANVPPCKVVFLNDLQGAPSACGCGHPLCRWTSDYGRRRTTVPLEDDAAAQFVREIRSQLPDTEVIPVWTTECEEHDGTPEGLCGGVNCYQGICWRAYTRQLMPVAETCERIAVLTLYKEFQRDLPQYGAEPGSWVEVALGSFQTMPPRHAGKAIGASRLIAVLQGWDVTESEIESQRRVATGAGVHGYVVIYDKMDQSWTPKIVPWK